MTFANVLLTTQSAKLISTERRTNSNAVLRMVAPLSVTLAVPLSCDWSLLSTRL